MDKVLMGTGRLLARHLNKQKHVHGVVPPHGAARLLDVLKPADVLLVEGHSRVSTAIKYLTQSTWSHSALFIGRDHGYPIPEDHLFVEADLMDGVRTVGIGTFQGLNTRICRPVGLRLSDCRKVVGHAMARLGHQYDLRNVIDLARYLIATPPAPRALRRRMIALGSGDPTRAICSTLIAQAFQAIRYPILPIVEPRGSTTHRCPACVKEIFHVRHHSLFVPRDFDLSPYFEVVKPALGAGFDYRAMPWGAQENPTDPSDSGRTR